jgi:hypothetical protein
MGERELWEYEVMSASLEREIGEFGQKLNELGEKGWELAGVVPRGKNTFLVFKRPRG